MADEKMKKISMDELEQTSGGTFIVKSGPFSQTAVMGSMGDMKYMTDNQPAVNGLIHNQAGAVSAIKLGQDKSQPANAGVRVVCGGNPGEMA